MRCSRSGRPEAQDLGRFGASELEVGHDRAKFREQEVTVDVPLLGVADLAGQVVALLDDGLHVRGVDPERRHVEADTREDAERCVIVADPSLIEVRIGVVAQRLKLRAQQREGAIKGVLT